MKYQFGGLLTMLISLFILSSCENPSRVGLELSPEDQLLGELIDTLTVYAKTIPSDTTVTSGSSQFPLGYLQDPVLGNSRAEIAFAVAPHDGDSRIPLDAHIDSAILVINYGTEFTGDSLNSTNKVDVYQLSQAYQLGNKYYNTEQLPGETDPIGSVSIHRYAFTDSVRINSVKNNKDTAINVGPQLRIPLNPEKLKTIFSSQYDSAEFADGAKFHSIVKGFKVKVDEASHVGIGGIVNLEVGDENGLYVYYRNDESDTVRQSKYFAMDRSQTMASISHDFSEAITAQISDDSDAHSFERVFVEGPVGLVTKVSFPFLEQLKEKDLVINKAELILQTDQSITFPTPAPRLTLYRKDIAGQPKPVPDGDTRQNYDPRSFGTSFGGHYIEDQKYYSFILTSFVQDFLMGKFQSPTVFIGPASVSDKETVPYTTVINTSSRAVLHGTTGTESQVKLKIYYTKKRNELPPRT